MGHVIIRLMGGLGNQMFQYAAGYALAEHCGAALLIDRTFLDARPVDMDWTPRELELDVMNVELTFATQDQVEQNRRALTNRFYRRASELLPSLLPDHVFLEQGTGFDGRFFQQKPPVLLEGFWQNESYFSSIAVELRERLFSPKENIRDRNAAVLREIQSSNCASVHVRRGDYVSNSVAKNFHGLVSKEHYVNAAKTLVEQHHVEQFFVFSDNAEWVRQNLELPAATTFVDHNAGRESHWDIFLMKHCRHHIIANSSFSWWGAWLNQAADATVIAPRQWFQGKSTPSSDILPPSWIAR